MSKKAGSLLKCQETAETPGTSADPNFGGCIDNAKAEFDGGADPSKGCFEKLENKSGNDCATFNDTAAAEAAVDACVDALVTGIDPGAVTQTMCGVGKKKCVAAFLARFRRQRRPGEGRRRVLKSPWGASVGGFVLPPKLNAATTLRLVGALQRHASGVGLAGVEMRLGPALYDTFPNDQLSFALMASGFTLACRWLTHVISLPASPHDVASQLVTKRRRNYIRLRPDARPSATLRMQLAGRDDCRGIGVRAQSPRRLPLLSLSRRPVRDLARPAW
jgi:hypothetical protein